MRFRLRIPALPGRATWENLESKIGKSRIVKVRGESARRRPADFGAASLGSFHDGRDVGLAGLPLGRT